MAPRARSLDPNDAGMEDESARVRPRAGTPTRVRSIPGFRITDASYAPNGQAPPHAHDTVGLAVVLEGGYRKRIERAVYQCAPGMLTIEPSGAEHGESYGPATTRALLFEIQPPSLHRLLEAASCLNQPLCLRDGATGAIGRGAARELQASDAASSLALEALAFELIALADRAAGRGLREPSWFGRVRDRLQDEFLHPPTVASLAGDVGIHPTHLARVFRSHEGCSIGEWVRRRRVEWAADQLLSTGLPIALIAQAAGFADQSHFTRVFASHFGLTPARFRLTPSKPGRR